MEGNGREWKRGEEKENSIQIQRRKLYTKFSFDRFPWIQYLSVELYIICLGPEGQNFSRRKNSVPPTLLPSATLGNYLQMWWCVQRSWYISTSLPFDPVQKQFQPSLQTKLVQGKSYNWTAFPSTTHSEKKASRNKGLILIIDCTYKNNWKQNISMFVQINNTLALNTVVLHIKL